jgi:hypothetical protein
MLVSLKRRHALFLADRTTSTSWPTWWDKGSLAFTLTLRGLAPTVGKAPGKAKASARRMAFSILQSDVTWDALRGVVQSEDTPDLGSELCRQVRCDSACFPSGSMTGTAWASAFLALWRRYSAVLLVDTRPEPCGAVFLVHSGSIPRSLLPIWA